MITMDALAELEAMVQNAIAEEQTLAVSSADAGRWQRLFDLTHSDAIKKIEEHRSDLSRVRVPDELWSAVASSKEAEGFDRAAYEYSLTIPPSRSSHSPDSHRTKQAPVHSSGIFIIKLEGPLDTPQKVQEAARLNEAPSLEIGVGELGEAVFCQIDTYAKARLTDWLSHRHSGFKPTIVRLAKAKKQLCSHTMAPTLGVDYTLPQNRPECDSFVPLPSQNQYPVWYFFYGTLADPDVLKHHLFLTTEPLFLPATVHGGQVRTWAGKYNALVDAPPCSQVSGSAFLVESQLQEDALRFYETDKYEVVRCRLHTPKGILDGLTFRFDGDVGDMD